MYYVGIDVGGTGLKAGVVNEQGKIIAKASCPTGVERGPEPVIHDMAMLAKQAIAQSGVPMEEVAAIGIGIPGIMDPETGIVPFCTNLFWHNVPLVEWMHRDIDKPIFVGNDATVAGLAESVAGVSAGAKNSIFITLGTGVGGGIVLDGKPFSGVHGVASEIGHMIVVVDGEMCTCGNPGCWERYASATAIIRMGKQAAEKNPQGALARAVNGNLEEITAKHVMDLAKAGDPDCLEIFHQYVKYLCVGIVNLINLWDPEIVVLGGGVSYTGEFLLDAVRKKLPEMVFYKAMPFARIELATLGNDAGIIGAAMLGR
ncbi:MAG: ROK family protein [Eubacteriales bacterium]|nr:ROK family protein [Eubacteriales bacterium]